MIESLYAILGFFIGYKMATLNIQSIVKKEVLKQLEILNDWTLVDKNDEN